MLAKPLTAALGLLALTAAASAEEQAASDDPVVAIVNGTQILLSEVELVAQSLPEQMRQVPLEQIYPLLLDRVIDFRLISAQAEAEKLGDEEFVQLALERARASVLRDALLQQKIEQATTDEVVRARYEEMKKGADFAHEEIHARHILLESEDEAKAVIADLQKGADFEALAKERSTGPSAPKGGDLGYFSQDQMVPEFGEKAFNMEIGTTSDEPVKTEFGWHVIKVEDKRTVEPTLEETAPQLREDIAREVVTALVEDLREGAEIERFNMDGTDMEAPSDTNNGNAPAKTPAENSGG